MQRQLGRNDRNYKYEAVVAYNLLICFCTFDLSRPIREKYIFIENLYIVFSLYIAFLFNLDRFNLV